MRNRPPKSNNDRRIALINLPRVPKSDHRKLYNKVLNLALTYGDVKCYEEDEDLNEGDAGFYLPLDKEKKFAYGCAFVEFESASSAEKALKDLSAAAEKELERFDRFKVGKSGVRVLTGDGKALLVQCLGCSGKEASKFLDMVDGDISMAADAIIGAGFTVKSGKDVMMPRKDSGTDAMNPPAVAPKETRPKKAKQAELVRPAAASNVPNEVTFIQVPDESLAVGDDDRRFYASFAHLVDNFIKAVCGGATKKELRDMIQNADAIVNSQIGSDEEYICSNLVNRPSFRHCTNPIVATEGRTPLAYAVAMNMTQCVHDLIDIGADVSKTMASQSTMSTALIIAASNKRRDGNGMIRVLLSKGADPDELAAAGINETSLGLSMRYWLDKARRERTPSRDLIAHVKKTPPMDRLHELDFAVVGEEAAVSEVQDALAGRFGNPQGNRKPLVMLLLGPPGHGKTYFASNAARSLFGEENFLFVPCQSVRDDADLFGSRLGGSRGGNHSSDGQLTSWLRQRQGQKCVVFLDEIEKMKGLHSSLGWGQSKKIFQSFLESWNDGTLTDPGASSSGEIDCSQTVWILTSNWGQREIIDFCEANKGRMHKKVDRNDAPWIKKNLVTKILRPLITKEFGCISEDLKALCRRIDAIVPFLEFTIKERKVVADNALTERFSFYREPCVLDGPVERRRSFGNLRLHSTRSFAAYAASMYDPMQGAGGILSAVQQADGKFQMMYLRNQMNLTPAQKQRITDPKSSNVCDEPEFWVHYDQDADEVYIAQSQPPEADDDDDDDDGCSDSNKDEETDDEEAEEDDNNGTSKRASYSGSADDAF